MGSSPRRHLSLISRPVVARVGNLDPCFVQQMGVAFPFMVS
jgi:hypothetical protein